MESNPIRDALRSQLFGAEETRETQDNQNNQESQDNRNNETNEETQDNQGEHDNVSVIRGILTSVIEESAREEEDARRRERDERERQYELRRLRIQRDREAERERQEERERQRQREVEQAERMLGGVKFTEGFGNERRETTAVLSDDELLKSIEESLTERTNVAEVKTRSRLLTELSKTRTEGNAEYQRKVYFIENGELGSLRDFKKMGIVKGKESINKLRRDATTLMTGIDTEIIPKLIRFDAFRYTPEVYYVGREGEGVTLRLMFNNLFSLEEFSRENNIPDVAVKQPYGLFEVKVVGNTVKEIKVMKSVIEVFDLSSPFVSEVARYKVDEEFDGKRIKALDNIRNLLTTDLLDLGEERREGIIKYIREGVIDDV